MQLTDMNCREFVNNLSSKSPVPGGGGASALVGAVGTALGNMVGALTVGKPRYAQVEAELMQIMAEAKTLQDDLLALVERDAEVFEPLSKAYGMPTATADEKAEKERVMATCLRQASDVPLEIMRKCCQAIELHKVFAEKGSVIAISDAGVGVIFCKAALQGAALNVFINTKVMVDREYADKLNQEAEKMLMEYTVAADEIYASVYSRLKK